MSSLEDRFNSPRWEGAPKKFGPDSTSREKTVERDYCGIAAITILIVGVAIYFMGGYIALSL